MYPGVVIWRRSRRGKRAGANAIGRVDVKTEAEILIRLREALPRAIVVIVAHRAESLARCDRLVFLDQGRLDRIEILHRPSTPPH